MLRIVPKSQKLIKCSGYGPQKSKQQKFKNVEPTKNKSGHNKRTLKHRHAMVAVVVAVAAVVVEVVAVVAVVTAAARGGVGGRRRLHHSHGRHHCYHHRGHRHHQCHHRTPVFASTFVEVCFETF